MIKNPNPLAHNAVDPRVRVRTGHRIQHHRLDPSQSQFAGQHQPIRAGSRDNDVNHLAGFRVVLQVSARADKSRRPATDATPSSAATASIACCAISRSA